MKNKYVDYKDVTKEVLDSVKVGDMIKCNDWVKPMKVIGVSENYFVMIDKIFRETFYSVCEKKVVDHSRNNYTKGSFRIGTDDYLFGDYKWNDEEFIKKYLQEFETGETQLSVRRAIDLKSISIK